MKKAKIRRVYKTDKANAITIIKTPSNMYAVRYVSIENGLVYPSSSINGIKSLKEAKNIVKRTSRTARLGFLSKQNKETILTGKYLQQRIK